MMFVIRNITTKGSTIRRLVCATSLATSDKECLSDKDLDSLINDTNATLWRVPGSKNEFAPCTVYEITGNIA